MVSSAAQGHFAAEFATFLVATAGVSLVGLRPELLSRAWWARVLLVLGFAGLAAAAFLQGSLIVLDRTAGVTNGLQGAGLGLLLAGTLRWTGGATSRRLIAGGVVVMAASLALTNLTQPTAADAVLGVGAVFLGVGLLNASRRSVAARVAVSAAGTLLVVVLVLSVSLSTVLANNIDQEQARRLESRAATEQNLIQTAGFTNTLIIDRSAALLLSASPAATAELQSLATSAHPKLSPTLTSYLGAIRPALVKEVSLIYVAQSGQILGLSLSGDLNQAALTGLVGSMPVQQVIGKGTISHDDERGSVEVIGKTAMAIGVEPVPIADPATRLLVYPGVLLAVQPLDSAYLALRQSVQKGVDPDISLALATGSTVLAQSGSALNQPTLVKLASQSIDGAAPLKTGQVGDHFYSVTNVVAADQRPVMALITAIPVNQVTKVRRDLFRTLFLIALGGTLVALLLAAVVGERIGAGLRTLTAAAHRIQRGDFNERSGVRTDDEVGVLGTAFDSMAGAISEQTAALQRAAHDETALRNQLQAVVAGMGEALVAVDGDGEVTLINRAAEELLEVDGPAVVGRPVEEVIVATADDGSSMSGRLRRPSPSRWTVTTTLVPEHGQAVPVAITSGALRGPNGGLAGAVFVLRDLRPEREVERMKSEFLSRIGHELRTPLTAILGYTDILLRRKISNGRARQFYDEIYESGKRLSRIVEMLEFSAAAEAGRSLMRPERVSVRALIDGVVGEWQPRCNGNHAIGRRVARGLPDIVADRRWLTLSLNELVDNAVKFSPEGGRVTVMAGPGHTAAGDDAVEISVIDEGVGMSDADRGRVFAEFIQADASDTRRFGGLGLGLSLVKRVAEAHGGSVTVTSTLRKGSKFSIVLPV